MDVCAHVCLCSTSTCLFLQMLGLVVNSFKETKDYDEADVHKAQASKMDILDIFLTLGVRSVTPLASCSEMVEMGTNSHTKASPSKTPHAETPPNNLVRDLLTWLYILGVGQDLQHEAHVTIDKPFGTTTS